ncbi:MAG: Maf family protein [Alphaproteobacteria bacterium]
MIESGAREITVILASASPTRQEILRRAGVHLKIEPAHVDEGEVKMALRADSASALQAAETLAELKAAKVSAKHAAALVIGADQILDCEGRWFDKPPDQITAAAHLRALSGKCHTLATSVCLMRGGTRLWHHNEAAQLTMRPIGEDFIARYLAAAGDEVLSTVGAYRLEGLGAQLFTRIEGDFFTILGLPLLPVLESLRLHGVLAK